MNSLRLGEKKSCLALAQSPELSLTDHSRLSLPKVMYPMLSPTAASVSFSSNGGSLWLKSTWGAVWLARRPSLNSWGKTNWNKYSSETQNKCILPLQQTWYFGGIQISMPRTFECQSYCILEPKPIWHCKFLPTKTNVHSRVKNSLSSRPVTFVGNYSKVLVYSFKAFTCHLSICPLVPTKEAYKNT